MFGHVAFRERSSRWPTVPFLVAMALAWSFAMMQNRTSEVRVGLGTMLAVAVGLPALRDGVILIGRRRREKKAERHGEADETPAEESTSEENRPTYEDIFGAPVVTDGDQHESSDGDHDDTAGHGEADEPVGEIQADGDAGWTDDGDQAGDGDDMTVELEAGDGDGMTVEVDGDGMTVEVETGDGEQPDAEVDEPTADVEAIRSELESEEAIRLLREEFKARAQEAELRIKQRQAELEQAPSA